MVHVAARVNKVVVVVATIGASLVEDGVEEVRKVLVRPRNPKLCPLLATAKLDSRNLMLLL